MDLSMGEAGIFDRQIARNLRSNIGEWQRTGQQQPRQVKARARDKAPGQGSQQGGDSIRGLPLRHDRSDGDEAQP